MSYWTHITACISVETDIVAKKPELKRRVMNFLKEAPSITGTEGNADIFVNIPSGHNLYIGQDCIHCKYKPDDEDIDTENYHRECAAPKNYDCSAQYQTCVVISIQGDLRDRLKAETKKEFNEFMRYIDTEYYVRDYSVNIEED